jgi:type II secretory pathway component PulC
LKLSQIKNLSWTLALCSAGFCGFYTAKTLKGNISAPVVNKWTPAEPVIDDFDKAQKMSEHKLMNALAFLTKIDEPPKAIFIAKTNTDKAPPPPPPPPPPVDLKLPITLTFIAYNEETGRHVAFIKENSKFGHPYFVNDSLLDIKEEAYVAEIKQSYVIVKNKQGLEQKLELKKTAVNSQYGPRTARIASNILGSSNKVHKAIPKKSPTASISQKNKFRIVPKSRNVSQEESYGIKIIQYNTDEKDKRYAISEADKNKLEKNQLRLLSEINANPSYDNNGNPVGIKLDFMVDDPLLKKYGFTNGDIVTHINDKEVKSVQDGQGIYDKLSPSDRRVKIQKVDKNKNKMIIYFEMDDFPNVPAKR